MMMTKPNTIRKPVGGDGKNRKDAGLQYAVFHHILLIAMFVV